MSCFKKTFITIKLILLISLNTAFAQDPDTIIAAKVNDHVISAKDVLIALEKLPTKIKEQPLPSIYPKLINELINQHLIAKQAYKEKLDQDKEVLSALSKSKEQIMAKFWLRNYLIRQTNKKNIKAFYDNYLKGFKASKEVNASHILVKEEKIASDIILKLNNKSNFEELAKEFSIGPSGKNGGNLNWFRSGQMVKSFEEATFALNKGQITQKPIKTKFGFHVILLNDIREAKPKDLSQIKQNIIKTIRKDSLLYLEKQIKIDQIIIINKFEDVAKKVNN